MIRVVLVPLLFPLFPMPQGVLRPSSSTNQAHQSRKAASKTAYRDASESGQHKSTVTKAINKRIEELMAGRLVHEGGGNRLKIVPKPENVDKFVSSAAKVSKFAAKDLHNDSLARRARQRDRGDTNNTDKDKAKGGKPKITDGMVKKRKLNELGLGEEDKGKGKGKGKVSKPMKERDGTEEYTQATEADPSADVDSEEELERYLSIDHGLHPSVLSSSSSKTSTIPKANEDRTLGNKKKFSAASSELLGDWFDGKDTNKHKANTKSKK